MEIKPFIKKLGELNACIEAKRVIRHYKTSQEWWDDTDRGDWMLWLAGKNAGEPWSEKRKKLVLTACKCARLLLKHIPDNEKRPLKAIETAEAWANGDVNISIKDVLAAADAVDAAADVYAADAAYVYAADAAYDAVFAAVLAVYAAFTDDAADVTDAAYAKDGMLKQCAAIVREAYPNVDELF